MDVYEQSTAPLILFYRKVGLLLPVAATGSPDEICTRTLAALEARATSKVDAIA
jgi:adenylate kinase family enzyme